MISARFWSVNSFSNIWFEKMTRFGSNKNNWLKIWYYSCFVLGSHLQILYYHHHKKLNLSLEKLHLHRFWSKWRHRKLSWRHLEFQLAHREIFLQFSRWATGKSSCSSWRRKGSTRGRSWCWSRRYFCTSRWILINLALE